MNKVLACFQYFNTVFFMEQFKCLQVRMDPELHRKFRLHAMGAGVGMSDLVKDWIRYVIGEPVATARKRVNLEPDDATIVSGSSRMNSEVTGKSERDRQMEESPPVKVNPSTPTPKSKPDLNCKHSFAMKPAGGSKCVKCGWEP